jgi:hypothetical protein
VRVIEDMRPSEGRNEGVTVAWELWLWPKLAASQAELAASQVKLLLAEPSQAKPSQI